MAEPIELSVKNGKGDVIAQKTLDGAGEAFVIGRDPACDVVLDSIQVSPRQAKLCRRGDEWYVEDMGGVGGVFIDRRRMRVSRRRLSGGEELGIGEFRLSLRLPESVSRRASRELSPRILAIILLASGLVLLAGAWVVKERAASRHAPAPRPRAVEADLNAPSEIAPVRKEEKRKAEAFHEAVDLYNRGTAAFYLGDVEKAGALFRKSLALYPDNPKARDFLTQIEKEVMGKLAADAERDLKAQDMAGAEEDVSRMEEISPESTELADVRRMVAQEKSFARARDLFARGSIREAFALFSSLTALDRSRVEPWLDRARRELAFEDEWNRALAGLGKMEPRRAEAILSSLKQKASSYQAWQERIDRARKAAALLSGFQEALDTPDLIAALRFRGALDRTLAHLPAPGLEKALAQKDGLMKKAVLPSLPMLLASVEQDAAEADGLAASDPAEAARIRRRALDRSLLICFARPTPEREARYRDLSEQVTAYAKSEYDQAYVLQSLGLYSRARGLYENVVDLDPPGGIYHEKARAKLSGMEAKKGRSAMLSRLP